MLFMVDEMTWITVFYALTLQGSNVCISFCVPCLKNFGAHVSHKKGMVILVDLQIHLLFLTLPYDHSGCQHFCHMKKVLL